MRVQFQSVFNTPDSRIYETEGLVPDYIWTRKESIGTLRVESGRKAQRVRSEGSLKVKVDFIVKPLGVNILIFPAFTFIKEESKKQNYFVIFSSRYCGSSESNWFFRHLKVNITLAFMDLKYSLTYRK